MMYMVYRCRLEPPDLSKVSSIGKSEGLDGFQGMILDIERIEAPSMVDVIDQVRLYFG